REREPGGERHARLRRPLLRLVRHLERGRDRRAHRARSPPALALRSLLRLRAGRDRQPRRGLPARLRGALPLPGAPLARRARLARPLMRRPALLLGVQVAAVTASLGCLVAIAALHPRRLDLTPERRFTLSPYTREIPGRLAGEVRIPLFYSSQAGALRREMTDLLTLYPEARPTLTARAFDLDRSPGMAKRLGVSNYNTAVVEAGERREAVEVVSEEAVTAALLAVAGTPPVATYFVVGHGEHDPRDTDERRGASEAARALAAEGFRMGVLEGAAAVPADAGLVVVDAPGVRADYLATTAEGAWADIDRRAGDGATFRPGRDRRGPLPIATFTRVPVAGGREGRVVIIGDADFATNLHLGVLGNRDLLLTAAELVARADALAAARPAAAPGGTFSPLTLTAREARLVFWGVVVAPSAF